jgi:hypothetical protein
MPKLQPAVMNLHFSTTATDNWIDLSQAASIVNRRFYRQGLNWAVAGFTFQFSTSDTVTGNLRVETLPTTWVCSNAWHKMFAAWHRQQREALEDGDQESVLARFNDFKVFMDSTHLSDYADNSSDLNATNLLPRTSGGVFATGEWQPSQIVLPNRLDDGSGSMVDPLEQYLYMVGSIGTDASAGRGVLSAYAFSRSTPQSPDPAVPANVVVDEYNILRNMFDVGNDNQEVLENAIRTNDELPYDQDLYPGTYGNAPELQLHSEFQLSGTVIGNRLTSNGGNIPCGLIKITNDTGVAADITVHLVPGNHRGYLAEPMQDM